MHHGVRANGAKGGIGHTWEPGHGAPMSLGPASRHPQPLAKILQNRLIPAPFQCVTLEVSKEPRGEALLGAPHPALFGIFPLENLGVVLKHPPSVTLEMLDARRRGCLGACPPEWLELDTKITPLTCTA